MQDVNRILFPTDFSATAQNAFQYCLWLADKLHAEVDLLHVVYPEYEVMDLPVVAAQATQDKIETAHTLLNSFIEMAIRNLQKEGMMNATHLIRTYVELGSPASIIVQMAEKQGVDLIIMGTKGSHNILEKTLGSVTTEVIRKANCPVWVVPEEAKPKAIKQVAYGTDAEQADSIHIWEVGKILEPFNPAIHCVHVNRKHSMEKILQLSSMESLFNQGSNDLKIDFQLIEGQDIRTALEEFILKFKVDLLVMYAPKQDFLSQLFHRSNTQRMALETHIPLLVMKD